MNAKTPRQDRNEYHEFTVPKDNRSSFYLQAKAAKVRRNEFWRMTIGKVLTWALYLVFILCGVAGVYLLFEFVNIVLDFWLGSWRR